MKHILFYLVFIFIGCLAVASTALAPADDD
jgi:hypothetical protein